MSRKNLRAGVVGLGKMGLLHASILNVLPDVQLVALCERSRLISRFSKRLFKEAKVVGDVGKLSALDLDIVYITTPIFSHSFLVKKIYSDGIASNVFVEKTLASSYDEAKELCDIAQSFGGTNAVGFMKRCAVTFKKAKTLLSQESMGDVHAFRAYAYSSDFLGREKSSKKDAPRGGALRDLGSHVIDLALWYFGDFRVYSTSKQKDNEEIFESPVNFMIKGNSLTGEFNVSRCMPNYRLPEVGLIIEGSEGIMNVNDDKVELKLNDGKSFLWYRQDLDDSVNFYLGASEYYREDEHFVKSVLGGRSSEPSFYTASKVDRIIDEVT